MSESFIFAYLFCPVCDQFTWHLLPFFKAPICLLCRTRETSDAFDYSSLVPGEEKK